MRSDQAATSTLACTSSWQRAQGAALAAEGGEHTGQSHPVTRTTRDFAHSIRAPEPTFRDLSRPLSRPAASAAHRHRYRRLPGSRWAGIAAAGKPTVCGTDVGRGQPANAPRLDPGSIPEGPPAAALRRAAARSLRPPYLKRVNKLRKENQLPEVQLRILAFAANSGAWGEDTERLWSEMCEAAKGMSESADLWGWSAMSWAKHWQQRIGVTLARGRAAVLLVALRRGDSENVMIDENVARREVETMEWSADVGAGSQATAAAEMQRWA